MTYLLRRRSSRHHRIGEVGFLPTDLLGLKVFLEAQREIGLVDTDPLLQLTDQSTNGNSPTQANGSKQAVFRTGILNGKAIYDFDGTDDIYVKAVVDFQGADSEYSAYVVFSTTETGPDNVIFGTADESVTNRTGLIGTKDGSASAGELVQGVVNGASDDEVKGSTAANDGAFHIGRYQANGSAYVFELDNIAQTTNVLTGSDSGSWLSTISAGRDNFTIGGLKRTSESHHWLGRLALFLYFDSILSAGDDALIKTYINDEFAL